MLKRLHLQNFTVFADADFEFSPGLNVLVGTNGTGKSHVLKLGYGCLKTVTRFKRLPGFKLTWNENNLRNFFREELTRIFIPESRNLERLIKWQVPEYKTLIEVDFASSSSISFSISKASNPEYALEILNISEQPDLSESNRPIFIPAKEILTLSWLSRLDERYRLPVDGTYLDLFSQLGVLPLKNIDNSAEKASIVLEKIIGGKIEQIGNDFYIISNKFGRVEMNMIAEGIRKFGTLAQLLTNGSLTKQTTLYWDEPEANLNPALLRQLAAILAELARQGFQIILATHSTDLLKEFHILSRQKDAAPLPIKYFGLNAEPGEAVRVVSTDNFEFLPDVVALEAQLKQADELEQVFIRDDQAYYADNRGAE